MNLLPPFAAIATGGTRPPSSIREVVRGRQPPQNLVSRSERLSPSLRRLLSARGARGFAAPQLALESQLCPSRRTILLALSVLHISKESERGLERVTASRGLVCRAIG